METGALFLELNLVNYNIKVTFFKNRSDRSAIFEQIVNIVNCRNLFPSKRTGDETCEPIDLI